MKKSKFNQMYQNKQNIYSIKNWIHIFKSSKMLPNFIEQNLPFLELKQKLIWQNIHGFSKNLIKQVPSYEADYGNLLSNIFNCNNGQLYTKNDLLNLLPKTWCYYSLFQTMPELIFYVYKFDFQNCQTQNFSLVNQLKKIFLPEELNIYNQKDIKNHQIQYAQNMKMTTGNLIPPIYSNVMNQNVTYLCLNTNLNCQFTIDTINHELFHYMQHTLNKFILSEEQLNLNILESHIEQKLNQVGLSSKYFYQYINTHEFWTYIHVNLINFLENLFKIMNINYPQITKQLFIKKLLIDIQTNKNEIYNLSLKIMANYETNMLKFLKIIFMLYQNTLWIDVKSLLKENFK